MNKEDRLQRRDSSGSTCSASRIPISKTPSLPRKQKAPLERHRSLQCLTSHSRGQSPRYDDDNESLRSGFSGCSSASQCDHTPFALNGTTYSTRSKKYIVHCSSSLHSDAESYLTPTQRANSTIRKLKSMLSESQSTLTQKDQEISRLTKELVELRLGKAENGRSPGGGNEENIENQQPITTSLGDSGHFEDIATPPFSPMNSPKEKTVQRVIRTYNSLALSPLIKENQTDAFLIQKNDVPDTSSSPLQRIEEVESEKIEALIKRIEELEKEKNELKSSFVQNEETHKSTYLDMFKKGQQAAIFEMTETVPDGPTTPKSVPELLKEFEVTKQELESVKDVEYWKKHGLLSGREAVSIWNLCRKTMYKKLLEKNKVKSEQDSDVTLKFLKSAFYYFLTDRENISGHLAAIQSILGFTPEEKQAIERASTGWK